MFLATIKHLKSYLETFITEICQYMKQKENKTNLMDHSLFQAHNPKRRNNILEQLLIKAKEILQEERENY